MKIDLNNIPEPLNANERFLHAIIVRQNIIIEQLTSIVEHITKERPVETKPVVNVEAKPKRTTRKRTSTKE